MSKGRSANSTPSTPARKSGTVRVGGKSLEFTNVDKPLYPDGFTKGQVVAYYSAVGSVMLAHLKGRAVTLKRYPDGTQSQFFFQKNCAVHRPEWVKTARIIGSTGETNHCLLDALPQVLWAANLAAIELHVPMARAKKPGTPTAIVFDLDPGPGLDIVACARLGLRLRELLNDLKLKCSAKVSGSKGLHVYVPLNTPRVTFNDTKQFGYAIAVLMQKQDPAGVTATMAKANRTGRVFIDWSQNDEHKTTVAAYSLRATPSPRVSAPVTWEEVEHAAASKNPASLAFTPEQVVERIAKTGDLFKDLLDLRQSLKGATRGL